MARLKLLGANIRKARVSQKMSQSQLAFEAGTTLRQIQRIERGDYHAGIMYYWKIFEALRSNPNHLMDWEM